MGHRARENGRGGFSLTELLIAMGLMATVLFSIGFALDRASDSYDEEKAAQELDSQAHRVLDLIAREFLDAGRGKLVPPDPTPALAADTLTYQRLEDYNAGAKLWGPERRIGFELETGELDDGIDNNGNGLIDEGVVVFTVEPDTPDEARSIRTHWVRDLAEGEDPNGLDDNGNGMIDERGLSFVVQGDVLRVRLTLERTGPGGALVTRTVETSVRIRN